MDKVLQKNIATAATLCNRLMSFLACLAWRSLVVNLTAKSAKKATELAEKQGLLNPP